MKNNLKLLYFLAIIKFVFPFALQNNLYEPHRDEFLYLAEANHMAWGYMESPPMLSVFSWINHLLGNGFFWIKFWPSLFGALTFILVGKLILSFGGKVFAIISGFLPFVFGAFLRVHFLFQPNFLDIFFWTLMAFSLIRFFQRNQEKWIYVFWVSVALGMLSKYSAAIFVFSILVAMASTPARKIFYKKAFYFGAIIAFLIFLPNLIWQYENHFPLRFHMKELQRTQLQYLSPADFLKDQIFMNLPCLFIWIAGLFFLFFSTDGKPFKFIGIACFLTVLILLIASGKGYYALGIYPVLFAFGAIQLENISISKFQIRGYVFVLIPLLLSYYFIPILLPIFKPDQLAKFYQKNHLGKTGLLKWEDQKNHPLPQDFADMLGWEEMTKKTAAAYFSLNEKERKTAIIFCDNYGEAGAINYYGPKYGLPVAYSDNASFFYWMPKNLKFESLVLVTPDKNEMQYPFIQDFTTAVLMDSITHPYSREVGSLIILLKNGNDSFKKMFLEKIEKDRKKMGK